MSRFRIFFDDAADIVFLTSSPGFAYESYGVRAMDYLLKPIRAIAEHHQGLYSFAPENGVFTLRLMLPMKNS